MVLIQDISLSLPGEDAVLITVSQQISHSIEDQHKEQLVWFLRFTDLRGPVGNIQIPF